MRSEEPDRRRVAAMAQQGRERGIAVFPSQHRIEASDSAGARHRVIDAVTTENVVRLASASNCGPGRADQPRSDHDGVAEEVRWVQPPSL